MTEFEINPDLPRLARRWPTYWSNYTDRNGTTRKGMRCKNCHELIRETKPAVQGIVQHLMRSHGYRMDGRQFDNKNQHIGEAKNACRKKSPVTKL
jgi:hypothetical protein